MHRFRADCSRCCGLCCVVPAFLAVQGFGADKPANSACAHLTQKGRCAIYAERAAAGYTSCAGFDCFGAGQWITQDLFGGARWSDSPEIGELMFAAYRFWAPRFEAAAMLSASLALVRDDARALIDARIDLLTCVDAANSAEHASASRLRRDTLALIRSAISLKEE
ncbi:MAG TPA: hypothetical protein VGV09_00355 [Steroidobacteraceae bacterium]|nr:hypothetical protein [Steroidobacteraceae bacterium]